MRIDHAVLTVDDQEAALGFYTRVLGFVVHTDHQADGWRWLTLVSPDDPDGTQLLLEQADDAARTLQRIRHAAGMPVMTFHLVGGAEELEGVRRRGARFVMEPTTMEYGGTDALVDDSVGNIICLHQD